MHGYVETKRIGALWAVAILLATIVAAGGAFAQEPKEDEIPADLVLLRVPPGGTEVLVEEIVRDMGERLDKVVAIEDAIIKSRQKIKFHTSADLTFNMLRSLLRVYGYEIIFEEVDGREILKAFMQRTAAQGAKIIPTPFIDEGGALPKSQQMVTAVYTFKYADANSAQNVIRVMQGQDQRRLGNIFLVPNTSTVVVTDVSDAVAFYLDIAKRLDAPIPGFIHKIVQVEYAAATDIAGLVNQLWQSLGSTGKGGVAKPAANTAPGGLNAQVVADERTNKVIILALREDVETIERLIAQLDVKVKAPPRRLYIYHCKNADASELADQLNALFGGGVSQTYGTRSQRTATTAKTTGSRTSASSRRQATQPQRLTPSTTSGAAPNDATLNPGEGESQIQTRIVPDAPTNTLLIQAAPVVYEEMVELLAALDKKRLRVLIEAQVWEISVSDDVFFAVDSALTDDAATNRNPTPLRGHGLASFGLLAPDPTALSATDLGLLPNFAGSLASGGLIGAVTKGGFDRIPLIAQALEGDASANLVTRPFTMTNDGETATFSITQSQPFQVTNFTSTAVEAFQTFDNAEAESTLTITPFVASGTNLKLEIELQIQSFGESADPTAPPPVNGRSYTGTVTIPNRSYVVFGGLEQETVRETRKYVPILGDIPFIGYLFGSTSFEKARQRVYVFVRPVIFSEEDFSTDKRVSSYLHTAAKNETGLSIARYPVVPDAVINARAIGARPVLYSLFDREGTKLPFAESSELRQLRRAAAGTTKER